MNLPVINYFANGPQTIYTDMREDFANGSPTWVPTCPRQIKDYYELAELAMNFKERVKDFVEDKLKESVLKQWLAIMGSRTPQLLRAYQEENKNINTSLIDNEINKIDALLSPGQKLYRGGDIVSGKQPQVLSTTFCPAVAINEDLYNGKAQKRGKLLIDVLEVLDPKTCVYVYKQKGTKMGHEKEVLFASGAFVSINGVKSSGQYGSGLPYEIISATIS